MLNSSLWLLDAYQEEYRGLDRAMWSLAIAFVVIFTTLAFASLALAAFASPLKKCIIERKALKQLYEDQCREALVSKEQKKKEEEQKEINKLAHAGNII